MEKNNQVYHQSAIAIFTHFWYSLIHPWYLINNIFYCSQSQGILQVSHITDVILWTYFLLN